MKLLWKITEHVMGDVVQFQTGLGDSDFMAIMQQLLMPLALEVIYHFCRINCSHLCSEVHLAETLAWVN